MSLNISLRNGLFIVLWVLFYFSNGWCFGDEIMDRNELFQLHFYRNTCPLAELIVKTQMKRSMMTDPTTAAALLRLAFHDCQVNGCDGSVLLRDGDSSIVSRSKVGDAEIDSQKNFGIKKLDFIDGIKSSIEKVCPEIVSCADIIQLAAREAIYLSGGPYIEILTGRRDGVSASKSKERADKQLPSADISVNEFIEIFRVKNISIEDGVALMGAHTLGVGHCQNFENRIQPTKDPTMSPFLYFMLRIICKFKSLSNATFAPNDATLFTFDNQYFVDIQNGRGLLKIDSEIARDPRTLQYVVNFGRDRRQFFERFSNGFLKLSAYRILLGEEGEIRRDCSFIGRKSWIPTYHAKSIKNMAMFSFGNKLPTVSRHLVSCITARFFVGIGKGEMLPSKDTRQMLLKTWLQPLIDDYFWLQHSCRSFDRKVVEEGIGRTILTLPLEDQQSIMLSWLGSFLKAGDNCPNLQRAFEVWWRRTFVRPYVDQQGEVLQADESMPAT